MRAIGLVLVVALGWASSPTYANTSGAFICEGMKDPYYLIDCQDAKGKSKPGFPMTKPRPFKDGEDVNADGRKDVLGSAYEDLKGNRVECWCLQRDPAVANSANRFAYAFVDKTKKRKWFGGCFFPLGINEIQIGGNQVKTGTNAGKYDEIMDVSQKNTEAAPGGTNDYRFTYANSGPNKGKMQKIKTTGRWVTKNGKRRYITTSATACPTRDPPDDPDEVLGLVVPEPGRPGAHLSAVALLGDDAEAPRWSYALIVSPSFPLMEPDEQGNIRLHETEVATIDHRIAAGDRVTIAASGVRDPFVSEELQSPELGGWQVAEVTDELITFQATADAAPPQGESFGRFGFFSGAPSGEINWFYEGSEISMSASVIGPALEVPPDGCGCKGAGAPGDPTLVILGLVVVLLALRLRPEDGARGQGVSEIVQDELR